MKKKCELMPSPKTKKILQHIEDQIILSFFVICMESHYYISAPCQNTDQSQWINDNPVYTYVVGKIPSI